MKRFNGVEITKEQGKEYLEDLFEWQDDYENFEDFFKKIQEVFFERRFKYTIKPLLNNGVKKFWLKLDQKSVEKYADRMSKAFQDTSNFDYDPVKDLYKSIYEEPKLFNNQEIIEKNNKIFELVKKIKYMGDPINKNVMALFGKEKNRFVIYIKNDISSLKFSLNISDPKEYYEMKDSNVYKKIIKETFELFILMEKRQELIIESCQDETIII